jgi:hypothetical protein
VALVFGSLERGREGSGSERMFVQDMAGAWCAVMSGAAILGPVVSSQLGRSHMSAVENLEVGEGRRRCWQSDAGGFLLFDG